MGSFDAQFWEPFVMAGALIVLFGIGYLVLTWFDRKPR